MQELLDKMDEYDGDISFIDALKLESGIDSKTEEEQEVVFTNSEWLEKTLNQLRQPNKLKKPTIPENVRAELRPYQITGGKRRKSVHVDYIKILLILISKF